jgi:hypothetical protein
MLLLAFHGLLTLLLTNCQSRSAGTAPSIEFTDLPPSGDGSPDKLPPIAGRVSGAQPGQSIVLYARSGIWWVQPTGDQPFTQIRTDSTWKNLTHPGSAYAALLVTSEYRPPLTLQRLPQPDRNVLAVGLAEGPMLTRPTSKTLRFSGYEWEMRQVASDRGGTRNLYDASNAWTDDRGFLHLRIRKKENEWTTAEVILKRSLGYGSYRFVVRDISHLEPAAVFSIFTWDDTGPPREMDIEISRWGEPSTKNAQYVVQPYYVPANAVRFMAPLGTLTHLMRWDPGRVYFRTVSGSEDRGAVRVVDEHSFTSGVPSPGTESIHINLYRFDNKANPLRDECEVIVEKFEYLP